MIKWQNLIEGKCPRCGGKLERIKDKGVIYECAGKGEDHDCTFYIPERKVLSMLADPDSPVMRFATAEQKEIIKNKMQ